MSWFQYSISYLNDERAKVLRVAYTKGVSRRLAFGNVHPLRTVGSRSRLLGGVWMHA